MTEGSLAIIGMGSNQGDREAILDEAVAIIKAEPHLHVWTVSKYYETVPVGGPPGQAPFLNAALLAEPSLDPLTMLERLHAIEARLGRVRDERWGARTLDLDLLLYGQEILRAPQITLPHPRLPFRRFALVPTVEIAPWMLDPLTNKTVNELLEGLDRRPSLAAVSAADPDDPAEAALAAEVHAGLVRALDAEPLRWSERQAAAPSAHPSEPSDRAFSAIQAAAHRASARSWEGRGLGDRWIAADFSLDLAMNRALATLSAGVESEGWKSVWRHYAYERAARATVEQALTPTLVVLLGRDAAAIRDEGFPRPVLVPDSADPARIVEEIVVACHATRA
jgi:2-amino-4-hydroxy-6-hydroxymethyldihydropteridine diphosphokinase